ncbi:MAG: UbiA-like polyprenyltransferase [Planctomycetota bacterium]|jgi:4-hydroxybenzoate polyprenyltransferase
MSSLATTLRMIRFEHTVFALPFALSGAWIAADGLPEWPDLLGILVAAVAARSAAMAFNNVADRDIDLSNPRTEKRPLVTGALSLRYTVGFTVVCSLLFVASSFWLSPLCGWLSLPVLAVLLGYSRLKRFSWFCHFGLGLALACAPAGAWLAVAKDFSGEWAIPLWIGGGVLFWVAGFDLLYALQDIDHDRKEGLFSFPARFGATATRIASMACYLVAVGAWTWAGFLLSAGLAYGLGLLGLAALLLFEHWLLRGARLQRVPLVFFRVNAWVGVLYFAALWIDLSASTLGP